MLIQPLEIVKQSVLLYKNNWRKYVPYLLLLFLPNLILSLSAVASLYLKIYVSAAGIWITIFLIALLAAAVLLMFWASIAFTKALKIWIENDAMAKTAGADKTAEADKKTNYKEMLKVTSHLIIPLLLTSLLVGLIVLGGFILFIIPGIIFSVWYIFVYYEVIIAEKKYGAALKGSKELVVGRWWSIIWRFLAPIVIFGLVELILVLAVSYPLGLMLNRQELYYLLSSNIIGALIGVLLSPLSATAILLLYLSAKSNPTMAEENIKANA